MSAVFAPFFLGAGRAAFGLGGVGSTASCSGGRETLLETMFETRDDSAIVWETFEVTEIEIRRSDRVGELGGGGGGDILLTTVSTTSSTGGAVATAFLN